MTSGRRPVQLTIAEKYDVILMKDSGESGRTIMEKYGISRYAVSKMYTRRKEIIQKFEASTMGFSYSTKRVTGRRTPDVDKVVLHWYLRCKERNMQITGAYIRRKAVEINEKINGHPGFKASNTWLYNFQKRYHIINADIREAPLTRTNVSLAQDFTVHFNKLLQAKRLPLKNVYNAVYTSMKWKAVPNNTLILNRAKVTGNLKMCEDYVIALFCANATGCHKLPILIIGNVPETHSLYNFNTDAFSTIYISKTNVSMDSTIFTEWYKKHFLKSILERQEMVNESRENSLLLLDNTSSFLNLNDLNGIDSAVTVTSPPSETPFVQPMECGIIACFMRKYRHQLLEAITPLATCNTEEEVIYLHKELSMWDCCRIVDIAWSHVDDAILIESWNTLLQRKIMSNTEYAEKWNADVLKTLELLHDLPGCELCEKTDVSNWFLVDNEYGIIDKIYTDEVLEEFKNNTLGQPLNLNILEDLAGPSHS